MIVIADTSPLNYLIQIEADHLLPRLYSSVIVPVAVLQELRHTSAPAIVLQWLKETPSWIIVRERLSTPDPSLASLDLGEREAIQLAQEQHADLLLIDERKGRAEAQRRGLETTGTLGVLFAASHQGWIDAEIACRRLISHTNFRISDELKAQLASRYKSS